MLGLKHPSTMVSLTNLAGVLDSQRKHEAAEEMYQQVVELRLKVLGPKHPRLVDEHEQLRSNARTSRQIRYC